MTNEDQHQNNVELDKHGRNRTCLTSDRAQIWEEYALGWGVATDVTLASIAGTLRSVAGSGSKRTVIS